MNHKIRKGLFGKSLGILALCAALIMGALTVHAGAAPSITNVTVQLCPQFTILLDGAEQTFYNAVGQEVHPILNNGTTYLPVRAIGELMGKNVNWDELTLTVTISGERTTPRVTGTPDTSAVQMDIFAQLRPDFTIIVDNSVRTFQDANGTVVYPLLYNGSTYLPVRAIGELMGCTVGWDGATSTVTLTSVSTGNGGGLVTDADTFNPTTQPGQTVQPPSGTPSGGNTGTAALTPEEAKQKALSHAGLTSAQVTFVKCEQDHEDGRRVYEIEFRANVSSVSRPEYEYEIDAATGTILSFEYENKGLYPSSGGTRITEDQARALALAKVPGASSGNVVHVRLLSSGGGWKYKVKIAANGMEYEFTIDAYSGAFYSWKGELTHR